MFCTFQQEQALASVMQDGNSQGAAHADDSECTLMLRNLSKKVQQEDVKRILDERGLRGKFSFVYVPQIITQRSTTGYAFVRFRTAAFAHECRNACHGKPFGNASKKKTCRVCVAKVQDGLDAVLSMPRRKHHGERPDILVLDERGEAVPDRDIWTHLGLEEPLGAPPPGASPSQGFRYWAGETPESPASAASAGMSPTPRHGPGFFVAPPGDGRSLWPTASSAPAVAGPRGLRAGGPCGPAASAAAPATPPQRYGPYGQASFGYPWPTTAHNAGALRSMPHLPPTAARAAPPARGGGGLDGMVARLDDVLELFEEEADKDTFVSSVFAAIPVEEGLRRAGGSPEDLCGIPQRSTGLGGILRAFGVPDVRGGAYD